MSLTHKFLYRTFSCLSIRGCEYTFEQCMFFFRSLLNPRLLPLFLRILWLLGCLNLYLYSHRVLLSRCSLLGQETGSIEALLQLNFLHFKLILLIQFSYRGFIKVILILVHFQLFLSQKLLSFCAFFCV